MVTMTELRPDWGVMLIVFSIVSRRDLNCRGGRLNIKHHGFFVENYQRHRKNRVFNLGIRSPWDFTIEGTQIDNHDETT